MKGTRTVISVATLVMLASPVLAAQKFDEEIQEVKGKVAMPQMDPTWYPNQLFWLAVSFILLYLLVSYVIVPRLNGILGSRKATISDIIAEAEALKDKAEAARTHFEGVEANARKEASAMVTEVTHSMNQSIAGTQASMDADLKKRIAASDAAIAEKLHTAQSGVAGAASTLAAEIYQSLLGDKIDAARFEQAIRKH